MAFHPKTGKKYLVTCRIIRDSQMQSYDNLINEMMDEFIKRYDKEPDPSDPALIEEFIEELESENFFDEREDETWCDVEGEMVVGTVYADSANEAIEYCINNPFDVVLYNAYRLHDDYTGE